VVFQKIIAEVNQTHPAFLVDLGDLVPTGTEANYQHFNSLIAPLQVPFYPVIGNHDIYSDGRPRFNQLTPNGQSHYSFDYQNAHFTMADTAEGGMSVSELAWLESDLAGSSKPLKFVFTHHPPFDPIGLDHIMTYGADEFMALMEKYGVKEVFSGHIHAYAKSERNGVTYFISGGAGAPLVPGFSYHYLNLTVSGQTVSDEVKLVSGSASRLFQTVFLHPGLQFLFIQTQDSSRQGNVPSPFFQGF